MPLKIARDYRPSGEVGLRVIRPNSIEIPKTGITLPDIVRNGFPHSGLSKEINSWRKKNYSRLIGPAVKVAIGRKLGLTLIVPSLYLTVIRRCERCRDSVLDISSKLSHGDIPNFPSCLSCQIVPLGLASMKVVTTAGVNYIVDAFIDSPTGNNVENFDFHGIGTGSVAEAIGDTALGTELTTQYNPDSTRATGTPSEGATANIYKTIGTNTVDAAVALTEHGILTQAATGGGTLLDRSVYTVINLASGDSLQSTYEATFSSGG